MLKALPLKTSFCLICSAFLVALSSGLVVPQASWADPAPYGVNTAQHSPQEGLNAEDRWNLTRLEQVLFNAKYDKEPVFQRLDRLESAVFGEAQPSQSPHERIAHLQQIFQGQLNTQNQAGTSALTPPPPTTAPLTREDGEKVSSITATPQSKAPPALSKGKSPASRKAGPQATLEKIPTTTKPQPGPSKINPTRNPFTADAPKPGEDYPTVTLMENRVLGHSYQAEGLSERLDRLEMKIFGRVRQGELMSRVDGLRVVVLGDIPTVASNSLPPGVYPPNAPVANYPAAPYNPYNPYQQPAPNTMPYPQGPQTYSAPPGYETIPGYGRPSSPVANNASPYSAPDYAVTMPQNGGMSPGSALPANNPDFLQALNNVERKVLKHSYPMEPTGNRLARLENKIFNTPAPPGISDEDRLQRIMSVTAAGGGGTTASNGGGSSGGGAKVLIPLLLLLPLLFL